MASRSNIHFGSQETHMEPPCAPKTPRDRGTKLIDDAQRATGVASRKNPSWSLPRGGDSRDITIQHLQTQLAKMA